MPLTLTELEPAKREVVRGLLGGATPEDLAWAIAQPADEVLDLGRDALVDLDPELAKPLDAGDRRRVAEYMLRHQSPGQAAGTWEVLSESADARRWALWIRESLGDLYGDDPPAIPLVDEDPDAPEDTSRGRGQPEHRLLRRRKKRERQREIQQLQAAALELQSPFRQEALDAYREADRLKLPHFASRRTRYTMYGLLAALLVGLVLAVVVRVPTFSQGVAFVAPIPRDAGVPVRGLAVIGVFPPENATELERGQALSLSLPNTSKRSTSDIQWVSRRVLSPREIVARFKLPRAQANQVIAPGRVAVAPLDPPPDAPAGQRFNGAVSPDADARTGSRRVISYVVP
jgi:hypothetical protein